MKKLVILLLLINTSFLQAQIRLAIFDVDIEDAGIDILSTNSQYKQIPSILIAQYSNDGRFSVIDKKNNQLIKDEKERQKSEDFIDGYIVEQGKLEGADYILRSSVRNRGKTIVAQFYNVKEETVSCQIEKKVGILSLNINFSNLIEELVLEANLKCFDLTYEVVRQVDVKKEKVKTLMIFGGYSKNVSKGDSFEIFEMAEEKIGDRIILRENVIAEGTIISVEDENFSILKVKKGGDVLFQKLAINTPLYCK